MNKTSNLKNAVVTGAGSGVGRAVALALAQQGWRVAVLGRREQALLETQKMAGEHAGRLICLPCDIGKHAEVADMSAHVLLEFGSVQALVNAAGTNTPKRSLRELSFENFRKIMETNLNGAYLCAQAFLPGMRERASGIIVNIVSDAAKQASAKAGPAYAMSKFGMAGLTQCINAEERANGIRACSVFPGDIDTPLLELRPIAPSIEARQKMLMPEDVAECVLMAINLPPRAIIEEILIRPR